MARKLRVGFVGLGRVFDLNVRGYLGHSEAEVAALCDDDPAILARRAAEHPGAHATHDFQNLFRSDLDLIEILTPHPLHEAMTVAALASGSHVSVQKPMAMTLPECDRMIEAAAASGRRLKVFENFVFYPPLVRARELLREGAIGRPLHFRMKVVMADRSAGVARAGGGESVAPCACGRGARRPDGVRPRPPHDGGSAVALRRGARRVRMHRAHRNFTSASMMRLRR